MKITSDTLYAQWRNITTLCPERCDLRWIDLEVTPIASQAVLDAIEQAQARPGQAKYGYDFFLAQIGELADEQAISIVPRIGASHLPLRYQKVKDEKGKVYFYDYCIVPKLSRVSAVYMAPDNNFKTVRPKHRFTPRMFAHTKTKFDREALQYLIANEGEDYYQIEKEYDSDIPLPTEPPARQRRGTAEHQWMDLNLLAEYTFTKDSVQLLYLPMSGPATEAALHSAIAKVVMKDAFGNGMHGPKQIGQAVKAQAAQSLYSDDLLITANKLLSEDVDQLIRKLKPEKVKGIPTEDFTDAATGRNLANNPELARARREAKMDAEEAQMLNEGLAAFVFSNLHNTILRHPDPRHESREGDHNPGYLFGYEAEFNPINGWVASVYDEFSDDFVAKTLPEWQTECLIAGQPLMPLKYIPDLFNRGLTSDNILYLSTLINENTPEEQAHLIIEAFFQEEAELRLR